MAFVASYNSRLFVGAAAWATYTRGFTYNDDTTMLDVTTLADTSKQYTPGQRTGTVSLIAAVQNGANWSVSVDYAVVTNCGEVQVIQWIDGVDYLAVQFQIEVCF